MSIETVPAWLAFRSRAQYARQAYLATKFKEPRGRSAAQSQLIWR